jgi:hypothetical protein
MRTLALRSIVIAGAMLGVQLGPATGDYAPAFPREGATKLIENERVIVWDVVWPKNQPTAMHEHQRDQVSANLSGGEIKQVLADGSANVITVKTAAVNFLKKGVVHSEEGTSAIPRHAIIVELK